MGALTYSIKEIIMTTITIKSARYVAITGTIVAIAKNGTRYQHGSTFSPCKGILTAAKITAAGAINDQFWTVLKSEVMVLAHAVARKIVAVEGWSYREALALALSWVMSDVSHARDAIETNGIDWAINYFVDAIFSDGLYEEDEDMLANEIAQLEALCVADTPTLQDVQQFPVLTDAEWDMIENKGNPEFCNYTLDEVMSEPVVDSIAPAVVKEEEVECPTINLVPANPVDTPVKVKAPLVSHINHAAMPRALEIIAEVQAKLAAQSK